MPFANQRPGAIRMPSLSPDKTDCACSWVVIKAGPGMEAISELKTESALCPRRYEHARMREQQAVIRSA